MPVSGPEEKGKPGPEEKGKPGPEEKGKKEQAARVAQELKRALGRPQKVEAGPPHEEVMIEVTGPLTVLPGGPGTTVIKS